MKDGNTIKTDSQIISDALSKSIKLMGMKKSDLSDILMTDLNDLNRSLKSGIEPNSLKGQVSMLIIKVYRSLFAMSGNNKNFMRHFLYTENKYFDARPVDTMKSLDGLVRVNNFLEAMNSKV